MYAMFLVWVFFSYKCEPCISCWTNHFILITTHRMYFLTAAIGRYENAGIPFFKTALNVPRLVRTMEKTLCSVHGK